MVRIVITVTLMLVPKTWTQCRNGIVGASISLVLIGRFGMTIFIQTVVLWGRMTVANALIIITIGYPNAN